MRIPKLATVGALAAAVALTVLASPSAQAVPAPNGYLDSLVMAGSDTTQDVDSALAALFNTEASDGDRVTNVPALFAGTVGASGDRACAPRTYVNGTPAAGQTLAPNGSGAGKTALLNSAAAGDGCVDIARSSSGRVTTGSTPDPSTLQYFAYARDAVGYATFGAITGNISVDQLRQIYSCSITNFNQVGGPDVTIQRYLPQTGSGTRTFFINTVLGGADPSTVSNASCPAVKSFQENDATSIQAVDVSSRAAILPFSAAQYVAQANQVRLPNGSSVVDRRNNVQIGSLGGQTPITTTGGRVAPDTAVYNSTYVGARNVYHVVDTRTVSYTEAVRYVGFDSTGPSQLCSGTYAGTLSNFGFAPLGADRTGSTCRLS